MQSIKNEGVLVPLLARPAAGGGYELLAGHRRKAACKLAGIGTVPVVVACLDDCQAVIAVVDSNLHRENLKPSEKAFAYKMKIDAIKQQGKRNDLTCAPRGHKSRDIIAEQTGESRETIRRYIRLTFLVPELLEIVDEGRMKMRPAVEISYLDEDSQRDLVDAIDEAICTPTHAQAIRLRKAFNENALTRDKIF